VLLVDDDDIGRKAVRAALQQDGWNVTEAENGRFALEQLAKDQPSAIVLDLMMPEMDGFTFLDEVRRKAEWRAIPIVVITAKDLTAEDRNRLNDGVERIIAKTGHDDMLNEVLGALTKCIERRNKERLITA
jgi:CheY-like chemotaxis protein